MTIDYNQTFSELKQRGYIKDGDMYAVCLFVPESKNYGVVIKSITSEVDYVMVANNESVNLFDIDKTTGRFLDSGVEFRKERLVFEKGNKNWVWASKGLFGGRYITIRADFADKFSHTYKLPKKVKGFEQIEARDSLYEFIQRVYNAHHDEQKRLYKENK